jgi:hypothetical protein
MCRQLISSTLTLALAITLAEASNPALARDGQSPAEVLARHELTRLDRVWILPLELELRQELAELPKRRERVLALEREVDQRIEQNRRAWQESQPAIARDLASRDRRPAAGRHPTADRSPWNQRSLVARRNAPRRAARSGAMDDGR